MRISILDAARELFITRGMDAVTMREIGRRVGLSATAIYSHFKDKQTLMRELCNSDYLIFTNELKKIDHRIVPMERLRLMGLGYVQFAAEHPNHYQLMFMTPQLKKDPYNSIIPTITTEHDAYGYLKSTVEEAWAFGHFRDELDDPDLIAQTLWAGLHGICAFEIVKKNVPSKDWRSPKDRSNLMHNALMSGLQKHPGHFQ